MRETRKINYFVLSCTICFFAIASVYAADATSDIENSLKTRIEPFSCDAKIEDCYEKAKAAVFNYEAVSKNNENLVEKYSQDEAAIDTNKIAEFANKRTQINFQAKKPKNVVIMVHGLWGNGKQFENQATWFLPHGFNVVNVVLPGHGLDEKNGAKVSYRDWIKEIDNVISLAKYLGDNIIFMGQSTGGMLGLYAALEYPKEVSGLILIEPAFMVKPQLTMGACVASSFFTQVKEVAWFARQANLKTSGEEAINMGCEVDKIRRWLEARYVPSLCDCLANEPSNPFEQNKALHQLFSKVHIPTLLINNKNDSVVESDEISAFKRFSQGPVDYITIDGKKITHYDIAKKIIQESTEELEHGQTKSLMPFIQDAIKDFLLTNTKMQKEIALGDFVDIKLNALIDLSDIETRFVYLSSLSDNSFYNSVIGLTKTLKSYGAINCENNHDCIVMQKQFLDLTKNLDKAIKDEGVFGVSAVVNSTKPMFSSPATKQVFDLIPKEKERILHDIQASWEHMYGQPIIANELNH